MISDKVINPNDIEVRFYGPYQKWLEEEIKKYGLSNIVKQYGIVPREIALKKQWESQILLLLNWEDPKEKGCYTGKIFEYLTAQRPILATGGFCGDVVEALLNKTKAGVYCSKIEDIKKSLIDFYFEYKQKGKVSYSWRWDEIQKYSYKEMARKFAELLNQITEHGQRN